MNEGFLEGFKTILVGFLNMATNSIYTSLNPMPNAQVCVYLMVHITKLQLQTTLTNTGQEQSFA
jgi:hypothetical protein